MWAGAASSLPRADSAVDGGSGGRLPALEPGSLRLQLAGGHRLGGRVAWDQTSGLLAAELQAEEGAGTIPVAILDPQAPETHFVAHVPATAPGERLAALLWSPRAARRLLLTITASGRAYSWTMGSGRAAAPAGPAAGTGKTSGNGGNGGSANGGSNGSANGGSKGSRGDLVVQCINEWFGHHAFDLPLAPAGSSAAPATQQQQPQSLLCCRFLEPPAAGAAWEADAAPPFLDRPLTTNEIVSYYQLRGLEQAFVSPAAASAAAAAASPHAEGRPGLGGMHWLRPGMLCLAAVTAGGDMHMAVGSRQLLADGQGSGDGGSNSSGIPWLPMPPVRLPVPVPAAGAHLPPLVAADVTAAAGGALLVAAAGPDQQVLLEVAGPPPQLLAGAGSGQHEAQQQQQQQQRVSVLSLPPSLAQPGSATLQLTFLPCPAPSSSGAGSALRLLQLSSSSSAGTSALLLTCHGSGGVWRVEAGASRRLCPTPLPAAVASASPDGSIAVLLPGIQHLLHLSGSNLMPRRDTQRAPLVTAGTAGSTAGSTAGVTAALATSPHCLYAAVAAPGASALLLLPLLPQPRQTFDVEHFMLKIGKRSCLALAMHSAPSAWWDVTSAAAAACAVWGHQHLQLTQQLVDAAVLSTRPEARARHVLAWGRLKAALLAAATAAHPAAAGDHTAAAVRCDVAAREWMAAAADIFEMHKPDTAAVAAAASKGNSSAYALEMRNALQKLLPIRYWAMWASEFAVFFTRCLLYWSRLNHTRTEGIALAAGPSADESHEPDWQTVAATLAFVSEQNAGADCLPCIRLLADGQFYRSFGRVLTGALQLAKLIERQLGSKGGAMATMIQLPVLQDAVLLLNHLHTSFKTNGGGTAVEDSARTPEVAGVGYSGAWTLVCLPPAPAVTFHQVTAAVRAIKERQGADGNSPLVERVRATWKQQGDLGGGRDSAEALLATAAHLCLLPTRSSSGVASDPRQAVWGAAATAGAAAAAAAEAAAAQGSSGSGMSAARLTSLLQRRSVALAAAEAGDSPVPLPSCEHPSEWGEWGAAAANGAAPTASAATQQAAAGERRRQQRGWEAERDAALGLAPPLPPADDPAAYIGRLDPLSGRLLSWEHPVTYVAADGSCGTSELQPRSQLPLGLAEEAWQAGYTCAAPVGGQPWKRVRAA